ncbi:maleylpyruvate isomerase family mycothiol-dependent enzyme [Egibacter rhizosphaerae]|uniref:Maleylpyruvate isomerase family mycothiol-dependent enzyme n=1 Tax=Egibacter rhizosphaerae TaxID=1670831 RepID=A0A411YJ92_9ACTN|nr:maleylpyruvate isomerase N-terminal domain-containing protein [Egibacter rhizosphaerae]QBI21375.1 maleylpyruvate isomerase family mycothiol-dependent enzyme [Egibacter rhizosphaerae]
MAERTSLASPTPVDAGLLDDAPATAASLWNRLLAVAEGIDEEDATAPTPCDDWRVRDVLAHCAAAQLDFDGAERAQPPEGWTPPDDRSERDRWAAHGVAAYADADLSTVRDELRRARDGHVLRLSQVRDWEAEATGPVGPTTEAGLLRIRCYDLWVHLQDLRIALDTDLDLADSSSAARAAYQFVLDALPRLAVKRAGFPDGSTMRLTVHGPVQRSGVLHVADGWASWDNHADPGECSVAADPLALTLLVSGRREPGYWRELELLEWAGPRGEQFVTGARLF